MTSRAGFVRRSALAAILVTIVGASAATAQDLPAVEVFAGVSLARLDIGEDASGSSLAHFNAPGWHLEVTRFLTSRIGLVVDVSGHYRSDLSTTAGNVAVVADSVKHHGVLVGPRIRMFHRGRFRSSLRVLAGVDKADASGTVTVGGVAGTSTRDLSVGGTSFAAAFGGSFDVRVNERLTYRLLQPNYYLTRYGDGKTQSNMRLSTGLVFTF